eukprot:4963019-Lingulodinium_polyedra.AAC.1
MVMALASITDSVLVAGLSAHGRLLFVHNCSIARFQHSRSKLLAQTNVIVVCVRPSSLRASSLE